MTVSFKDQVYWVTGASSGIGAELVHQLVASGAKVVLFARRKDRLRELEAAYNQTEKRVLSVCGDVTRPEDLQQAVRLALETWGRLDGVIANAGFGVMGNFEELSTADYRRQFETNVFGVLETVRAALVALKQTRGVLVLLGSVAGYASVPGMSAYSMSKFAVRTLAESLRLELAPDGVSVVLISPGFIKTEFQQIDNQGRFHTHAGRKYPEWLFLPAGRAVRQILKAISHRKREQIITWHGKCFVFLRQHFGGLYFKGLEWMKIQARKQT